MKIRRNIDVCEREVFEVILASQRGVDIKKTALSLSEVLMRGLLSLDDITGGEVVKRERKREVVRVEGLLDKVDELKANIERRENSIAGSENGKRKREIFDEVDELKRTTEKEAFLNGGSADDCMQAGVGRERERKKVRKSLPQQWSKLDPKVEEITKIGVKIQQYEKQVLECTELVLRGRMVEESKFLSLSEMLLQEILAMDAIQGGEEFKRRRKPEIQRAQKVIDEIDNLKTKVEVFEGDQVHPSKRCWWIRK